MTGDSHFEYDEEGRITAAETGVIHAVPPGYEEVVTFYVNIDWGDSDEELTFTCEG